MSPQLVRFLPVAATLCLSAAGFAQGSDDCATAQPIAGTGTFPFNNVGATTGAQGQTNSACLAFGNTAIQRDVWFTWVAPSTNHFSFATCGQTTVDTKIAVYAGSGCPAGAPIACNEDNCSSLQSKVELDAIAGNSYTFQLGVFPGAVGGTGTFSAIVTVAPPPCGTNTGPDVIVGAITDVMNVVAVGGIDAIALGTTSCNIGTAVLNWVSNTPNHPVIRQSLYRYKVVNGAGTFQQAGLSWLKHAFAAGAGSLCCTCTSGGGGLGVGCSDPYGAGLNGSQGNAGPNWQVNAHTGGFAYPPANPSFSGAIARRCQLRVSELEVTGGPNAARFFAECHYVTPDDAVAGNQNNNASWREMTCTGGPSDFSLSLIGSTSQAASAIRAWPTLENGVTLTDVQIPGDGLIVLGSKATNLGTGQYHYEYAVYNMNADRDIGTFSVPVPAGVNVTNIVFHDIDYHDGDGVGNVTTSGTDWTGAFTGGAVTWSTEAQGVNANANAIRWGSLYNFRFDADAPPISGIITLTPWKAGSPATVTGAGDVPGNGPFSAFCLGDGSTVACPCGNDGAPGHGCANSAFAVGGLLQGTGSASVFTDTVQLVASDITSNHCVFFQGDAQSPAVIVDDGLGCVTGSLVRIGTQPNGGSASLYPDISDASVSVRGGIPGAGGTYYYQAFYRNNAASFCPPATSNRTNAIAITWAP